MSPTGYWVVFVGPPFSAYIRGIHPFKSISRGDIGHYVKPIYYIGPDGLRQKTSYYMGEGGGKLSAEG